MFNVGGGEILVILLLALLVLGPDKLPEYARKAGRYMNEFRRMTSGFQEEFRQAIDLGGDDAVAPDEADDAIHRATEGPRLMAPPASPAVESPEGPSGTDGPGSAQPEPDPPASPHLAPPAPHPAGMAAFAADVVPSTSGEAPAAEASAVDDTDAEDEPGGAGAA